MELVKETVAVGVGAGGGHGPPTVLVERADVLVVRTGDVVVKAHAAETCGVELVSRLTLAEESGAHGPLLRPVRVAGALITWRKRRMLTVWPYGKPVDPVDPDVAPWEEAAALLARLHGTETRGRGLPRAGGPGRVRRAVRRLRDAGDAVHSAAAEVVCHAFARLPELNSAGRALTHGDFHLGQLVCVTDGGWRLIDIDDLGIGDPAWDLARPAAMFAAGVLEPAAWQRFLTAYRDAGGVAVPAEGDEWAALDLPARAVAVQAAALALVTAALSGRELDDLDTALVDACRRIAAVDAIS
ncbi:aminoglycoside phosphotransferase family protein [Nocardia puris]|uniref:Phosphotransferase family enzyme n=1 Tax=Nocardia puris TaxID=208602 RepID=A0A366DU00_9NOCA|nr:aminoglycoside phosphotransferase family protein [Nocardia puris]RBO92734.1 phosphotransferase family enzyme [Nocardia puris]